MYDDPQLAALLATAQDTLRREVIEALPVDKRHAALMVANAMSIVSRALAKDRQALDELQRSIPRQLGLPADSRPGTACELIRAGRADPGTAAGQALHAQLAAQVRAELEITNPKLLNSS